MAKKVIAPDTNDIDDEKEGMILDSLPIDGEVAADYVPEGFKTVEDFLCDMRDEYEADIEYDRINRDMALEDKKFSAGEQWDPIVLEQRKGLPCLVINSVPQFTAQLVGDWRQDRKAMKIVPTNDQDTDIASVREDLIRSIELQSRADRIYDSAFESLVQCGDGAFRVSVEYARDDVFDQDIFIRPIEDCLAVVWDRYAMDPTGRDARRVFVDDRISKKEFKSKWPDANPDQLMDNGAIQNKLSLSGWVDDDSYRVSEYWRLIQRKKIMALFEDGKIYQIDEDTDEQDLIYKHGPIMKKRSTFVSYAQMHLVTGFAILSGPFEYRLNRLPIVRMSGRVVNVGGRRVRYGLVRFMKDPIRLKNFWRSVIAEQYGYAPKAQWIAPESAVEGREAAFRKAHLSRDPLLVYNDGAEAPPERIEPPAIQQALSQESMQNAQDMKDVTGIQDASLGIASNEVSGRAITARQKEGDIASLTFYDNADAALVEATDITNQLIPQIYDGTRVIRCIGEDETIKFHRINDDMDPDAIDLGVGQFDVAPSTGVSYTSRRVEAAQAMMDAIQVYPEMMQIAGDLVVKAQDWPGADKLSERLKKTIPPQYLEDDDPDKAAAMQSGQLPNPQQIQQGMQKMQELTEQVQKLTFENQKLKSDKSIDQYNAETQRIRALSDNQVDGNAMEMKAIQMILDGSVKLDEHDIQRRIHTDKHDQTDQHFIATKALDHAQFLHGIAQSAQQTTQDHENALELAKTPSPDAPSTTGTSV